MLANVFVIFHNIKGGKLGEGEVFIGMTFFLVWHRGSNNFDFDFYETQLYHHIIVQMINLTINFLFYFVNTCMLCIRVDFEIPNLIAIWYIIKVDFCMQNLIPKIKTSILSVVLIIANNIDQNLKLERTTWSEMKIGKM
jgi:hypothetical protein